MSVASVSVLELPSKKIHLILLPSEEGGDMITMEKFMSILAGELGRDVSSVSLMIGDRHVDKVSDDDRTVHYFLLDSSPWYVHTFENPPKTLHLMGLNGKITTICGVKTISELKAIVEKRAGILPHQCRLIYHSKEVGSNDNLCDIPDGATLFLVLRLAGGGGICSLGMPFVDVTDKAGPVKIKWSNKAPSWRVAGNGLCLEGKCTNKHCKAFGQMVIMNQGYTEFDLINEAYKCKCPICSTNVVPITCGFNNCEWKVIGRKINKLGEHPQMFKSDWKSAGNAYEHFSPDDSGTAHFLDLKIFCKKVRSNIVCVVCANSILLCSQEKKARCGHIFHSDHCFDIATSDRNCIECMAVRSMTDYQKLFH